MNKNNKNNKNNIKQKGGFLELEWTMLVLLSPLIIYVLYHTLYVIYIYASGNRIEINWYSNRFNEGDINSFIQFIFNLGYFIYQPYKIN